MDAKINSLKPGQSIEISRCGNIHCTAERSGDGRRIRFVRHSPVGFVVFRDRAF